MEAMRIVETGILVLEPQVAAHAEEMFVVLGDPAIYEYENEPPQSVEALRERFHRLESRRSTDGHDAWLNWVVRLPSCALIGYVQAAVGPDGRALIAYVLNSAHWGRGLGGAAVQAMLGELVEHHGVRSFAAVHKRENRRSARLLERLGFVVTSPAQHEQQRVGSDEILMERGI